MCPAVAGNVLLSVLRNTRHIIRDACYVFQTMQSALSCLVTILHPLFHAIKMLDHFGLLLGSQGGMQFCHFCDDLRSGLIHAGEPLLNELKYFCLIKLITLDLRRYLIKHPGPFVPELLVRLPYGLMDSFKLHLLLIIKVEPLGNPVNPIVAV